MDSWHNHLTNMISFHARGKLLEDSLNFRSFMKKNPSPLEVITKTRRAEDIKKLYTKAWRMCKLLIETQGKGSVMDLKPIEHNINSGIRRIDDILSILDFTAKKWHLNNEEEAPLTARNLQPETVRAPDQQSSDLNSAQDNPYNDLYDFSPNKKKESEDPDKVREEIKLALKAIIDVVDYMELPTLVKMRNQLDKLVEY